MRIEKNDIQKKLEYIGLDIGKIPNIYKKVEPLNFRASQAQEETMYREYRFINVNDIEIIISNSNKSDSIEDRYKKSRRLSDYLNNKDEESIAKHAKFLKMLKNVNLADIKHMEDEQDRLNEETPFKIKYKSSYLWQIYYAANTNKYFLMASTEDLNNTALFYLMKKQLEGIKTNKIFVPVRNVNSSGRILTRQQIADMENYIWLFTKDWALVNEVYDQDNKVSLNFVGKTCVYGNIKSDYKIKLENKQAALRFYKLLKAVYILQTEVPKYFTVKTNVNKEGSLDIYIDNTKIEYQKISRWLDEEYNKGVDFIEQTEISLEENSKKIEKLKTEGILKELEYLTKEKQISTFLECKKTFFGKFKYYFKYSKKNKKDINRNDIMTKSKKMIQENDELEDDDNIRNTKFKYKKAVTLEDIIKLYRVIEKSENQLKNLVMDINAIKLKNKNFDKKIENASKFIEEIDNHKKSIFEFWRYTNKDEMAVLPEGEKEEVNVIKKIKRTFDFESDMENFGSQMDRLQRNKLNSDQLDSIYICTTELIDTLNKVKCTDVEPKELEVSLKKLKAKMTENNLLNGNEEFDIFGGVAGEGTRISNLNNKVHREAARDMFNILNITRVSKCLGYKLKLERIIDDIKEAMNKIKLVEDVVVYKAMNTSKISNSALYVCNLNPEEEVEEIMNQEDIEEMTFFKMDLDKDEKVIGFTNSVFFDNQNKTLPIGQDISSKVLIDMSELSFNKKLKSTFNILKFNDDDEFSDIKIIKINVIEFENDIENK